MHEKKVILAVDDEPQNLKLLEAILLSRGYEVLTASNGEEALKIVSGTRVDVMLLDVLMPHMDGLAVKARLNEDALTAAIPVIFLTAAKIAIDDKVRGLGIGADDYVIKPFEIKELLARIDSVLKRRGYYEDISMTDAVTGLYNTAFFKKQFTLFFNMAKRYNKIFSLAIVDIDDMKHINDTYGHTTGDLVLKNFSSIAMASLRRVDIITRYGGDEFAIIFPEQDAVRTGVAIERLRKKIEEEVVTLHDKGGVINFSVSVGIAAYDESFTEEIKMFELADARLYEDKRKNT
jgi:diguanylate cyclase (GGDEF)-like protein